MNDMKTSQDETVSELFLLLETMTSKWESLEDANKEIRNVIQQVYNNYLICQPIHKHRNEVYQRSLYSSLEDLIFAFLHNHLFSLICTQLEDEDKFIYNRCLELADLKVTADQLGTSENYAIPLHAAIVELASMDIHTTPREKYVCLSDCFDLIFAELKGAIVDVLSHTTDNEIPIVDNSDITAILATIIIHSKPIHLISNLYYIENFSTILTNHDCIAAFRKAIEKIKHVAALPARSSHIYCDLDLKDIFEITSNVDSQFDRSGKRVSYAKNPLERYIELFTANITAATLASAQQ